MLHKLYIRNSCNTLYPRDMVCFRYIFVNTLYKVDNKVANNIKDTDGFLEQYI